MTIDSQPLCCSLFQHHHDLRYTTSTHTFVLETKVYAGRDNQEKGHATDLIFNMDSEKLQPVFPAHLERQHNDSPSQKTAMPRWRSRGKEKSSIALACTWIVNHQISMSVKVPQDPINCFQRYLSISCPSSSSAIYSFHLHAIILRNSSKSPISTPRQVISHLDGTTYFSSFTGSSCSLVYDVLSWTTYLHRSQHNWASRNEKQRSDSQNKHGSCCITLCSGLQECTSSTILSTG